MKFSAVVLTAIAQVASAHYFFDVVSVNSGAPSRSFQYIRSFTRPTAYNPIKFSSNPAADIRDGSTADGPDIVCNQGAFAAAGKTDILTVSAGQTVTAKLGVGAKMQHPGPSLVYMSKAPSTVKTYDGSGDWFKIFQEGVCAGGDFTTNAWCSYDKDTITATIPKGTPNGEYLVRFEHIGVHRSHVNQPEHYVSCLQVKVQNGGTGTPGPMVKFPGAYKATDPYANFSIYNGRKDFTMPGPAVWNGASGAAAPAQPVGETTQPTTLATVARPVATPAPSSPVLPSAGCGALYQQCGGQGFTGAKCCSAGRCNKVNDWYSQCLN